MAEEKLEELLAQEIKGRLLRITLETEIKTAACWLTAADGQKTLHSRLHPDDPLPFSDGEWGTILLEDLLGEIPDPHAVMREAWRVAQSRLLIVQRLGEGRSFSRLRQISAKYSPLLAGKTLGLSGEETALLVIPREETPQVREEFSRRPDRLPLRFVLKIGAPSAAPPSFWGDIHYAEGFQRSLIAAGHECTLQYLSDWEERDEDFDIVVHLKGLSRCRLKPCHINIMWMINHPELHREEELAGYDGLMVASRSYAEELAQGLDRPIAYAPQAVEVERFAEVASSSGEGGDFDLIFIGNNHQRVNNQMRAGVADLLKAWQSRGRAWKVGLWGRYWEEWVPPEWIQGQSVLPEEAARLYRRAKISLNDHHPGMKSHGFVNERTFIIGACGAFQICDHVRGIEELPVVFYESAEDLGSKIEFYLSHPEERKQKAQELQALVPRDFTFAGSAARLEGLLGEVRSRFRQGHPGPLVSIVAATYNRRKFLPRALKSALQQTFRDWEMILVNDGGEEVGDIVEQQGDSRIRYVNSDHVGKGHALNVGLRLARGRYVAYLDDDDYYHPEHLERLVKALRESPAARMVYSDYEEIWEETEGPEAGRTRRAKPVLDRVSPFLAFGLQHMTLLHYRSLLEESGVYDESLPIFIDWDMTQRLALISRPRHLPGASTVHTLRTAGGKIAPEHIHGIRGKDEAAYLSFVSRLIERASARLEQHPSFGGIREELASLTRQIDRLVSPLAEMGEPRRPEAFSEFAQMALRHTYFCGLRDGWEVSRGKQVDRLAEGLAEMPETVEGIAWLESLERLSHEIERLRALCEEQWQALQRIRCSLPYRAYRAAKSLVTRWLPKKAR